MLNHILDFFNLNKKSNNSYLEYVGYIVIGVLLIGIGSILTNL